MFTCVGEKTFLRIHMQVMLMLKLHICLQDDSGGRLNLAVPSSDKAARIGLELPC